MTYSFICVMASFIYLIYCMSQLRKKKFKVKPSRGPSLTTLARSGHSFLGHILTLPCNFSCVTQLTLEIYSLIPVFLSKFHGVCKVSWGQGRSRMPIQIFGLHSTGTEEGLSY